MKRALALPQVKLQESETSDEVISHYGVVTTGVYNTSSAKTILQISSEPKGFVSNFAYEISKHRCYDRELDGLSAQVAY